MFFSHFTPTPDPNRILTLEDRALGAYLGFAIGDALGATVEFMTSSEIRQKYGCHQRMVGGGWLNLRPGQVTDDTQMSLVIGESLLRCNGFDLQDIAEGFARWLKGRPIDVGNTCRRGIRRFINHGTLATPPSDGDGGNGACMRNLPVALATLGDHDRLREWSLAQSHITHNHPFSDAATLSLGLMVHSLMAGYGKEAALIFAEQLARDYPIFRFADYRGPSSAFVGDTIRTVLFQFSSTDDFRTCVLNVVNQGGDADTTGALAGMLAGAAYGVDSIPRDWLFRLDSQIAATVRQQAEGLLVLASSLNSGTDSTIPV